VATATTQASQPVSVAERFNRAADWATRALGSMAALLGSVVLVVLWALTGPLFHFSDTWQLFINTTTTVITFWMVFVIQNSANREAKATQLKLDELIRAVADARNEFIALDRASDSVMAQHETEMNSLAEGTAADGTAADAPGDGPRTPSGGEREGTSGRPA
jgi:low affinity Fe/Cu permease